MTLNQSRPATKPSLTSAAASSWLGCATLGQGRWDYTRLPKMVEVTLMSHIYGKTFTVAKGNKSVGFHCQIYLAMAIKQKTLKIPKKVWRRTTMIGRKQNITWNKYKKGPRKANSWPAPKKNQKALWVCRKCVKISQVIWQGPLYYQPKVSDNALL